MAPQRRSRAGQEQRRLSAPRSESTRRKIRLATFGTAIGIVTSFVTIALGAFDLREKVSPVEANDAGTTSSDYVQGVAEVCDEKEESQVARRANAFELKRRMKKAVSSTEGPSSRVHPQRARHGGPRTSDLRRPGCARRGGPGAPGSRAAMGSQHRTSSCSSRRGRSVYQSHAPRDGSRPSEQVGRRNGVAPHRSGSAATRRDRVRYRAPPACSAGIPATRWELQS